MLFDSHCHLHDKKFDDDRDQAIARARSAGVCRILTLGDTLCASRQAIALAESQPDIIAAAGIHPSAARSWDNVTASQLEQLLAHPKVKALGEIGLDYYWEKDDETHRIQRIAFREQLAMARRLHYPVSIHSRDSNDDVLDDLRAERGSEIGGVLHCFNGTWEQARAGIEMGFLIGVGGTSTYPKSNDLREVLRKVGPRHIVLETDSPYLPPQPCRGRRNEPAFVAHTCALVAEFLGQPSEDLQHVFHANTLRAFRLEE